ncbi:TPA: TauD/TfdA family dioxygenase [Pseudomonas aeruginosa]|nr:TauD/TfdA family dioxygenase [Pseudomonas aeruginosa]
MSASFSAPRLRPRQLSAGDLVEESLLDPANDYLRIVRARQPGMDLRQWIAAAGAGLRDSLLRHGGILFRGFAVDGAEGFSQAVQSFSPNMLDYLERAAARQEVAHRVFTSTEFSPDGWIPPHHEMSYSHNWPSYIHFYCQTPPATQGRTPLADERRVSARIPEAIRQCFLRHGVCYVRNYGPEIDLTWQEGFQTDSQSRRGRGLLPADRYPMDLARRPAPEYPPGTPGDGAPPAQRRDAVVQPRAHVPCLQHAAGPGPGLARRGRRTGPAAQRLLRRRQPDRGGGAGHHPRRLPRGNPRVRLGARRCPDARQLHQRPRPRAVHRRAQGTGGDDRPACPPTLNPCEG